MPVHQPLYGSRSTGTYESITTTNDRGLTPACWRGLDVSVLGSGRQLFYFNDFHEYNSSLVTGTQATTGTIAHSVAEYGAVEIDCNSTTNGQGFNVQFNGPYVTPAAGELVIFECRLKVADIATGPELFAGLATTDTTIIASDAVAVADWMGFYSLASNAVYAGVEDGTQSVTSSAVHTLVDDTYVKLGIRVHHSNKIEVYVDGELVQTNLTASAAPDAILRPSFVCQSNGTTDPILHVDWFAVGYAV